MKMIFKTRIHVCPHVLEFSNLVFFSVSLSELRCVFTLGHSTSPCNSFSMFLPFGFSVMINPFPYIASKLFCLLCLRFLLYLHTFNPLLADIILVRCFWMTSSFVCIIWSYLCNFVVFFLLPVPSDISLRGIFIVLIVYLFFFRILQS